MTGADTMKPNGDIATLVGLFAEELSLIDRRQWEYNRSHHFDPTMPDDMLEARINQLPLAFPKRQPARYAYGGAFTLRRGSTSAAKAYGAGEISMSTRARPDIIYTNAERANFGIGVAGVTGINFVCSTPGTIGSVGIGEVSVVVSSDDGDIYAGINTDFIVGTDLETKERYLARAMRWLGSLALAQREALETVAMGFVASGGQTLLSARCVPDPDQRGFSRLVVDDGTAMAGAVGNSAVMSGTVPTLQSGRRYHFPFDGPAYTAPKLTITKSGGGATTTYTAASGGWSILEESGEMWLKANPATYGIDIEPGDTWSIGGSSAVSGHKVYKADSFVAQLQAHINRYCVAAGTRVRVEIPQVQIISIGANVVWRAGSGRVRDAVLAELKDVIINFVRGLAIGEPLLLFKLIPELRKVQGVENVVFDHGDLYCGSPTHRLVTYTPLIVLR